jgi:hypothetical protein
VARNFTGFGNSSCEVSLEPALLVIQGKTIVGEVLEFCRKAKRRLVRSTNIRLVIARRWRSCTMPNMAKPRRIAVHCIIRAVELPLQFVAETARVLKQIAAEPEPAGRELELNYSPMRR